MATIRIVYQLVKHDFSEVIQGASYVDMPEGEIVARLKEMVKEKESNDLAQHDASGLIVWKLNFTALEDAAPPAESRRKLLKSLEEINAQGNWPEGRVHILVQVPDKRVDQDVKAIKYQDVLKSDLARTYADIFIKVKEWDKGFQLDDVNLNKIVSVNSNPPGFVDAFRASLDSMRNKNNVAPHDFDSISTPSQIAYFISAPRSMAEHRHGLSDNALMEQKIQEQTSRRNLKVQHIAHIASRDWERIWKNPHLGGSLKEPLAYTMFFFDVLFYLPVKRGINGRISGQSWPLDLITWRVDDQTNKRFRTYSPMSDFLIMKSSLPRLLVEVNSTSDRIVWRKELVRMLLQGASIVRFANTFVDEFKEKKDFVLPTIYIREDGFAHRYTLFQHDEEVVYYLDEYNLNDAVCRVIFARQLYNLIDTLDKGSEEEHMQTERRISELQRLISKDKEKFNMDSFNMDRSGESSVADDDSSYGGSRYETSSGAGTASDDGADSEELREHGYEVEPKVITDGAGGKMKSLFEYPANILNVHKISERSRKLIAKKVREDSDELKILKFLNATKEGHKHIISLLDSFCTPCGQWMILPEMSPIVVDLAFDPRRLSGKVAAICSGLINGLGYLHKQNIAHRDIKPYNLVVDAGFCLKIIDSDLAIQLKNEDEVVDDHCGTEGWIAPEVKDETVMYSPIKADRWSCGHVVLHLFSRIGDDDRSLRTFAMKLKTDDPQQRPSLVEWCAGVSRTLPADVPFRTRSHSTEIAEPPDSKRPRRED